MLRFHPVKLFMLLMAAVFFFPVGPARADGLIIIHNPPVARPGHFTFAPLEVTYHKVDCTIDDQVAVTSVDQEFYNPNNARLEGDYVFPVPQDAQIDKFTMDIDGKAMDAELLPADKARAIYEDVVRKARDPALLEYAGRAMFHVRIFPIEPNSKKHITLKYTELLKSENNLLHYRYTLNTEKYSAKPLQNVSIKIDVHSSRPITSVYSPSHTVEVSRHSDGSAVVGYEAKDIRPDTDFQLYIGRQASPVGLSLLTYKPEANQPGYFVLLAAPTVSQAAKPLPKDVVFVMDTSGSMAGVKIEQAKKALKFCVNSLNKEDRFEIVRFSTEAEPFFKGLQDANDDNRKRALDFVEQMKASGGTAIDDALKAALSERFPTEGRLRGPGEYTGPRPFLIVFVTDGQPTVGEQNVDNLLATFKSNPLANNARVFTFGVGNDVNTTLLDQLAEQSRGAAQYVLPSEDIEVAVSNFFGKVQDPMLSALKLETGVVRISQLYPKELPDLFKGDQLVVFGSYETAGKSAVTISGTVNGKEEKFSEDVDFPAQTDSSDGQNKQWIGKLWAVRRVGYLLDEIRVHGENRELKDEVTELARKWGIVTPYTAMLIIEDERARRVASGARSLNDMERDNMAMANNVETLDAMRTRADSGDLGVKTSINTRAYKDVDNLSGLAQAAQQDDKRFLYQGQLVGGLAHAGGGAGGGGRRGAGGMGGGGGSASGAGSVSIAGAGGIATISGGNEQAATPGAWLNGTQSYTGGTTVMAGTLNTNGGALSVNGANTMALAPTVQLSATSQPELNQGYRVVTNYAQQNRVVNNRAFYLNSNQWTDATVQKLDAAKTPRVKVAFNSDAYFTLLKDHPETASYLALGNNVTFELGGTIYEVADEGVGNRQ